MGHKTGGTVLCLAGYAKGQAFMEAMHELGWHVILLTKDSLVDSDWPRDAIDELHSVPTLTRTDDLLSAATEIARSHSIDRVVGLDDFDITTAAEVREHLGLPGMNVSGARRWKDKLTMRLAAREAGIRVPPFTSFVNENEIGYFLDQTEGPWVLKPRGFAGGIGIRKATSWEEIGAWYHELGTSSADHILEAFIEGDVHHVDSLVVDGRVAFAEAHAYGRPPLGIVQGGGVFTTRTMRRDDPLTRKLAATHEEVVAALGLENGVTHAEFIVDREGVVWFLEAACRVGGAFIADVVEHATGVSLWREWARLEIREPGDPYHLPALRSEYAGVAICLAQDAWPDLSEYSEPEVVDRPRKQGHAAIILRSGDPGRLEDLLRHYALCFEREFLMVLPPLERPAA